MSTGERVYCLVDGATVPAVVVKEIPAGSLPYCFVEDRVEVLLLSGERIQAIPGPGKFSAIHPGDVTTFPALPG
jgi:hypothetical protein